MSIETEASTDLTYLKGKIAQLEAEAKSIWAKGETYAIIIAALIVGGFVGHLV